MTETGVTFKDRPFRVAVDFDEVIKLLAAPHTQRFNEKYGTDLDVNDFHNYGFADFYGQSPQEMHRDIDETINSHELLIADIIENARESLLHLRNQGVELYLLTSRDEQKNGHATRKELERHVKGIFDKSKIILVSHPSRRYQGDGIGDEPDKYKYWSKAEVMEDLDIDVLIDDSEHNVRDVQEIGRLAVLFGAGIYAWSSQPEHLEGIRYKAENWLETLKLFGVIKQEIDDFVDQTNGIIRNSERPDLIEEENV